MPDTAGLMGPPTPLDRADRLAVALGLAPGQLWIKRDDLTPLAGGGNKVRKLDHLCAAALDTGADTLVTGGGPQSNHVRLTAAAARRLGLAAVAVLSGDPPARASGNLAVDRLLGVETVWTGLTDFTAVQTALAATGGRLAAAGRRPYVIPLGGANALGSLGYVRAAAEILAQRPDVALVAVPSSSGGTHAGLAVGLGGHERVYGVDAAFLPDVADRIGRLAAETAELAGVPAPDGEVRIDRRYTAAGYGAPLDEVADAMRLAARTEGLILDPVYTGRALAGLRAALGEGLRVDGPVVFVHCGGAYGLLSDGYADWAAGPPTPA